MVYKHHGVQTPGVLKNFSEEYPKTFLPRHTRSVWKTSSITMSANCHLLTTTDWPFIFIKETVHDIKNARFTSISNWRVTRWYNCNLSCNLVHPSSPDTEFQIRIWGKIAMQKFFYARPCRYTAQSQPLKINFSYYPPCAISAIKNQFFILPTMYLY